MSLAVQLPNGILDVGGLFTGRVGGDAIRHLPMMQLTQDVFPEIRLLSFAKRIGQPRRQSTPVLP